MKISTKGRYALRLMIDLAQNKEQGNISLKDVAKRQDISVKYLEQIATPLIRAGLIKSVRGAQQEKWTNILPKIFLLLLKVLLPVLPV